MKGLFQCPPWARVFCPFRACGAYMRNLYYGNYNFSYYSFFLRGYKGLKVVTICYY